MLDLLGRWTWCLREQRFRCHDHAVRAIATLGRLLGHERSLHRVRLLGCAEPLECRDRVAGGLFDGRDAGARGCAVDQHGAGTALTEPTPELRTVQAERIAQDIEEWLSWIPGLDGGGTAVDLQLVWRHGTSPSGKQIYHWQLPYPASWPIAT